MEHMVNGLVMKSFKTGRQVVDWVKVTQFTVDGYDVKVLSNEMVTKVAKTSGKERKERRLQLTIDGVNIIEVGTESVKKGSFIKRLLKITDLVSKAKPKVKEDDLELETINADEMARKCIIKANITDVESQWKEFTYTMIDECDDSEFDLDACCEMLNAM